jgi:hypothetical protein
MKQNRGNAVELIDLFTDPRAALLPPNAASTATTVASRPGNDISDKEELQIRGAVIFPKTEHQSYLVLCTDCLQSAKLPGLILEELKTLGALAHNFQQYVNVDHLNTELQHRLDRTNTQTSIISTTSTTATKSASVSRITAVGISRSFLSDMLSIDNVPDVQLLTEESVEKMFRLFFSIYATSVGNNNGDGNGIANNVASVSWRLLVLFCQITHIWLLLQGTMSAVELIIMVSCIITSLEPGRSDIVVLLNKLP